jgi:hypothetical protein
METHESPWAAPVAAFVYGWERGIQAVLPALRAALGEPRRGRDSDLVCPWRAPNPTLRVSVEDGEEIWSVSPAI